jgi:rhamnose transport system permease protein
VTAATETVRPGRMRSTRLVDLVVRLRAFGIVAVLILLVAVTTAFQSRYFSGTELNFILQNTAILALLTLGEAMVVITRNVDLSIGSVLGLSAFIACEQFGKHPGIPIPVVFLIGLGIGIACGAVNGALTVVGRVPSLVVTLATLYIIRGVAILIVGGGQVVASSLPDNFILISLKSFHSVPYLAMAVAVVILIGAFYMRSFRSGRELYAIGSNPDAARLAGIPIGWRVFTVFVVSGGIAGIAGVLWGSYYGTLDSTAGTGYELQVISAVVVGGVAIFGGSGSVIGAALGALLLQSIIAALYVLGISPFWIQAIAGAMLLGAITLDRVIQLQLTAALKRRSRLGA